MTVDDGRGVVDDGRGVVDDGRGVVDDGLQGERTALAWERTCLTFVLVGALLVRAGAAGAGVGRLAGVVVIGAAGVGLLVSRTRYLERDRALRGEGTFPGHPLLAGVGVAAVLTSVAALVTVVALAMTPTAFTG